MKQPEAMGSQGEGQIQRSMQAPSDIGRRVEAIDSLTEVSARLCGHRLGGLRVLSVKQTNRQDVNPLRMAYSPSSPWALDDV